MVYKNTIQLMNWKLLGMMSETPEIIFKLAKFYTPVDQYG